MPRVFDGTWYQLVAVTKLGDDADNTWWNEEGKRVYIGFGTGALAVSDDKGHNTSLFSPEANALFVAARHKGSEPAAIYVYDVEH